MPLLPPPNGTPISAHFQVISIAKPVTSSSETVGVMRIPPLAGPSAVLWRTTNARNPCIFPSLNCGSIDKLDAFHGLLKLIQNVRRHFTVNQATLRVPSSSANSPESSADGSCSVSVSNDEYKGSVKKISFTNS